jgi:hypothetical protein
VDRLDEAWDRLMWRRYFPPEDSVASLASLHAFVNDHRDKTLTVGDEQLPAYPHNPYGKPARIRLRTDIRK